MPIRCRKRRLWDLYRFPGFQPSSTVTGIFGDPGARVIALTRRSKKHAAERVGYRTARGTIARRAAFAICRVAIAGFTWTSRFDASIAGAAGP